MSDEEVALTPDLMTGVRRLAELHYGAATEDTMRRVVQDAIEVRLFCIERIGQAASELEEPMINLEVAQPSEGDRLENEVRNWMFRRKEEYP